MDQRTQQANEKVSFRPFSFSKHHDHCTTLFILSTKSRRRIEKKTMPQHTFWKLRNTLPTSSKFNSQRSFFPCCAILSWRMATRHLSISKDIHLVRVLTLSVRIFAFHFVHFIQFLSSLFFFLFSFFLLFFWFLCVAWLRLNFRWLGFVIETYIYLPLIKQHTHLTSVSSV